MGGRAAAAAEELAHEFGGRFAASSGRSAQQPVQHALPPILCSTILADPEKRQEQSVHSRPPFGTTSSTPLLLSFSGLAGQKQADLIQSFSSSAVKTRMV